MSERPRFPGGPRGVAVVGVLLACALVLWLRHASEAPPPTPLGELPRPTETVTASREGPTLSEAVPGVTPRATATEREMPTSTGSAAPAPPSSALVGVTVDTRGRPLAGVSVRFLLLAGSPDLIPSSETHSDGEGRFRFSELSEAFDGAPPLVFRESYMVVRNEAARRDERGAWLPLRIVLCPVANLRLLALDHADRPLANVRVSVRRTLPEPSESQPPPRLVGTTDVNGRAEIGVPAEALLGVRLEGVGWTEPATRCEGSRLTHDLRGEPLVLEPGETREVEARLGATVELRGRVLLPSREPVPAARIRILEGAREEQGWFDYRLELRAYSDGTFHAEVKDVDPATELTVIAVDGEFLSLGGAELPAHATSRRISVAAWLNDPRPIELVLEPLGTITGRVVDAAGEPVRSVVWALEPGEPFILEKGPLDFLPIVVARGPEPFELGGLVPGTYDLIVKRDSPRMYHRFSGIRTGAPTRDFVLEDDRNVRIRLVVEGVREGDSGRVILMRHQPRRPEAYGMPVHGGTIVVDACAEEEWASARPTETGRPVWTQTIQHADGRTITRGYSIQPAGSHELEPQQAGCYSIGYLARDRDGRPYARRLSPPYRLPDGEYTFTVSLAPTADLVGGGVVGLGSGLEVEVRDARGEVIATPTGARTTLVSERGEFRVEQVPHGRLEVRLGTAAGLRAGVALRSVSVVVDAAGDVEVAFP